jgi:hypothetical protein
MFSQNGSLGCVLMQTDGEALPIAGLKRRRTQLRPWVHRERQFDPGPANLREMSANGHDLSAFMFCGGVRWVSKM